MKSTDVNGQTKAYSVPLGENAADFILAQRYLHASAKFSYHWA
jgi:hypothetical protein